MENSALSYLTTGVPADSSDRTKQVSLAITSTAGAVLGLAALLAFFPSWPLAIGAVTGCAALGYVVRLALPPASTAGA